MTCLPLSKANDGVVDCLGGSDELAHCHFLEPQSCNYLWHAPYACVYQIVRTGFQCWNDTICIYNSAYTNANQSPCPRHLNDMKTLCSSNFYITDSDSRQLLYTFCESVPKWSYLSFRLSAALTSNTFESPPLQFRSKKRKRWISNANITWNCHRGIPTAASYDQLNTIEKKCFCPPSYFGDFCEYQNERVSLPMEIQVSSEWKTFFTVVYLLINNHNEIESYDQLHYISAAHCGVKINRYLLYSSRPKNLSKSYSVCFEVYNREKLEYRASWNFELKYNFLPVHRL